MIVVDTIVVCGICFVEVVVIGVVCVVVGVVVVIVCVVVVVVVLVVVEGVVVFIVCVRVVVSIVVGVVVVIVVVLGIIVVVTVVVSVVVVVGVNVVVDSEEVVASFVVVVVASVVVIIIGVVAAVVVVVRFSRTLPEHNFNVSFFAFVVSAQPEAVKHTAKYPICAGGEWHTAFSVFVKLENPLNHSSSQSHCSGLSPKSTVVNVFSPSNGFPYTDTSRLRENNISSIAINPANRWPSRTWLNLLSRRSSRTSRRWYWKVYGTSSATALFRRRISLSRRSLWKLSAYRPDMTLFWRLTRSSSNIVLKTLPGIRVRLLLSRYR